MVLDTFSATFINFSPLTASMENTYNNLIKKIREYFKKNHFTKAVIGLSGGVDSSLAAYLVSKAIGSENLFALLMPEKGISSKEGVEHAIKLAKLLKMKYKLTPINSFITPFKALKWKQNRLATANTKARIRANILYNYANTNNTLVIGTSNKTELELGYFTKYGDGASDIGVIGSLYKTDVYKLAKFLNLPEEITNKKPSPELYKSHFDEEELGATYEYIDEVLKNNKSNYKIMQRVKKNRHKTQRVPVI